jgi:hypothetical protein
MLKQISKRPIPGFLFAISLFGAFSTAAQAGGDVGNGGNTVTCVGEPAVLLDYYQATLPTDREPSGPALIEVQSADPGAVLKTIRKRLGDASPLFAYRFEQALGKLGPLDTWLNTNLKDAGDSGEPFPLPKNCMRGQVAIRQQETMFKDPVEQSKLSSGQLDLLQAHEALYYLAEQKGFSTSAPVRVLIRQLLDKEFSVESTKKAIRNMRGELFPYEALKDSHFIAYAGYSAAPDVPGCNLLVNPTENGRGLQTLSYGRGCFRGESGMNISYVCEATQVNPWPKERHDYNIICRSGSNHSLWLTGDGHFMRVAAGKSDSSGELSNTLISYYLHENDQVMPSF